MLNNLHQCISLHLIKPSLTSFPLAHTSVCVNKNPKLGCHLCTCVFLSHVLNFYLKNRSIYNLRMSEAIKAIQLSSEIDWTLPVFWCGTFLNWATQSGLFVNVNLMKGWNFGINAACLALCYMLFVINNARPVGHLCARQMLIQLYFCFHNSSFNKYFSLNNTVKYFHWKFQMS